MYYELVMDAVMWICFAIGVLAFITSCITQVIKDLPKLSSIPTNLVVIIVSIVISILAVIIVCQIMNFIFLWYYVIFAIIGSFFVYLVSVGGWERIKSIWDRCKSENSNVLNK